MELKKSYLKLHFIVVLWGFTAIIGLLINLSFVEVVFYRTLIAFVALAIFLQFSNIDYSLRLRDKVKLLLTGVLIAFHWLLFFGAARYSNASVSLIGMSTTTLWTSFLEPLFHKRKLSFIEILFGLAVILGLFIIYSGEFSYGIGLVMSLAAALLAALFSVLNYGYVRKYHPLNITFYEMIGAWLGTIPFLWIMRAEGQPILALPDTKDIVFLLILAIVCTVYANTEATKLLKKFSAYASNMVISMEPVYGILLALIFFGDSERMDSNFYLGATSLILAVFLYPVVLRKFNRIIR